MFRTRIMLGKVNQMDAFLVHAYYAIPHYCGLKHILMSFRMNFPNYNVIIKSEVIIPLIYLEYIHMDTYNRVLHS